MSQSISEFGISEQRPIGGRQIGLAAGLLFVLWSLAYAVGGELRQVAVAGLNALPFAALAALAYLGARGMTWAVILSILWLLTLAGFGALISLFFTFGALAGGLPAPGETPTLPPEAPVTLLAVMGLCGLGAVAGALCWAPPVRRAVARIVPLDPESFVHAVALSAVVSLSLICFAPLLVIGTPPALAIVEDLTNTGRSDTGSLLDMVYGLIWTIPCALVAVGLGTRRSLREATARLGLERPTLKQTLGGLGVAVLLVGFVTLVGFGVDWLWGAMGWPKTDEERFADLLAYALNPIGAVVIGVTAGLGEELAVRGALQPRLGIILSNLFFTSLHALQYSWDALLIVFIVGIVCGLVRRRTNTTTAAIVHGTYNFLLVMLAITGLQ